MMPPRLIGKVGQYIQFMVLSEVQLTIPTVSCVSKGKVEAIVIHE